MAPGLTNPPAPPVPEQGPACVRGAGESSPPGEGSCVGPLVREPSSKPHASRLQPASPQPRWRDYSISACATLWLELSQRLPVWDGLAGSGQGSPSVVFISLFSLSHCALPPPGRGAAVGGGKVAL